MLFLHWAANTLLQASAFICVLLYPFNLIAASFCLWLLCDFFLLSVWQKTAQPLRSSFLLQGAIDRLFWQLRGRCTLLDFKFKFKNSTTKQILKFKFFWCWWLVKNYLQVNKSNIQLFLVLFWYLETGQEIHQLKKIQWNNHKVRANIYLFIYYSFRHGLSVFFIIQN